MLILTQFLFRLSFGLAAAMMVTSSRQVPSGFFRVHSYVLLGLNALAAMVALGAPEQFPWWPPVMAAALSYAASAAWLYEKPRAGKLLLFAVAGVTLAGTFLAAPDPLKKGDRHLASGVSIEAAEIGSEPVPFLQPVSERPTSGAALLFWLDPVSGGLVLGVTFAAMLLGHWYLNTPTMQLAPLRRLVGLMAGAVALRAAVCAAGLALASAASGPLEMSHVLFLSLRWLAGLFGVLAVAWLTWQTLKVPNTQSATGILYVGVIATFLGELTAGLLSAGSPYPL